MSFERCHMSFERGENNVRKGKMVATSIFSFSHKISNKMAMMALYCSTVLYLKSLHSKLYNTWPIGFEHKPPETGLDLVALVLMVSNKKISKGFTK